MNGKFKLEIELGNDGMRRPLQVSDALRSIANKIQNFHLKEGSILDLNGNKVGEWGFEKEGK
jgi:hypothetical protein